METTMVLQSGFLSFEQQGLVKTDPVSNEDVIQSIKLGKAVKPVASTHFYYKELDDLFAQYNNDHRLINDFDFREQILVMAKKAFSVSYIIEWCRLQTNSPYLTATHKRFLIDMLRFIQVGKRSVEVTSWLGLLSLREASDADKLVEFNFEEAIRLDPRFMNEQPRLSRSLAWWTGGENGFTDLLVTLKVIFGESYDRQIA